MSNILAQGVRWDLSDLYASLDDPKMASDLELAESKAVVFEKNYKAALENPGKNGASPDLGALLRDYEEIVTLMTKPGVFSYLSFAEKTHDPKTGAALQKTQQRLTDIRAHLLFFEVCWNRLDEKTASRWMGLPSLKERRHFLEKMRAYAPHTLAEGEEKIMAIKSNTSGHAFSRLFDEIVNNIPFYVEENGRRAKKTEGEVLALFHSPAREERKTASGSLAEGLKAHAHILTYIFNMILADHRASMKIRNYKHAMDAMNLSNEIDLKSVQNLIESVRRAYPLAARYYFLKKKILGLEKFYDYDRYAPITADETTLDFKKCREITLSGYYAFSKETGEIAERFFSKRWIDAEIREGKQGGGFCCQTTPDLHPYILVNYTGSLRDVMTVAHELGHGIHQTLAAKKVGVLESDAPLTLAETASVFGEMLTFEKLFETEKDARKKLALLCGKIDDNFSTVFRQIAMTNFELWAHETASREGEIPGEALMDLWIKANAELYKDSVELTENYRHGWKYVPHFIHSPFYCYAYAFAQLFVLCLFQKYKENPISFVPQYFEMLSLGGSKRPKEIAAIAGLDIENPDFWQSGLTLLEQRVNAVEALSKRL